MPQNKHILEVKKTIPYVGGWLKVKLSQPTMDKLWTYTKKATQDYRRNLAGNISKEFKMIDENNWFFNNVLQDLIATYQKDFSNCAGTFLTHDHRYILNQWWINYQKQNEFNPIHDHSGVYSFVIWMQIPYDAKKQRDLPFVKSSNSPRASAFEFTYLDILGHLCHSAYDASEGYMLFFPSKLKHQVYPFYTSNKDRISISGNISLDPEQIVKLK